jgi:hypothetical protein
MNTKFSEDMIPLSDLKINSEFVKVVAESLMEAQEGRAIELNEAKMALGLTRLAIKTADRAVGARQM